MIAAGIITDVLEGHNGGAPATLGVLETEGAPQYGVVELDGGRVVAIDECPDEDHQRLLNYGDYAFDPDVFDEIRATQRRDGEFTLPDTIDRFIGTDRRSGGSCPRASGRTRPITGISST